MASSTRTSSDRALFLVLMMLAPAAFGAGAKDLAKAEFKKAQKAFDIGRFSEALAGYSEAYRLDPRPAFLFNIAQCHRQLGEYERSVFFLKRYLSYYPNKKAPNEKVVREVLAEMEQKAADEEKRKADEAEAARQKDLEIARFAANAAGKPAETPQAGASPNPAPAPPLEVTPFPSSSVAAAESSAPAVEPDRGDSLTSKWWFWTGLGVVAVGAGAGTYFALQPGPRTTTLGAGDLR